MSQSVTQKNVIHTNFSKKEIEILKELIKRPEGMRVETLTKFTNITRRTIYRTLNKLKDKNIIESIVPIWKIRNGQIDFCHSLLKDNNIFELHNLSYVVKLINTPTWWNKRKNYLCRLKEWQFKNVDWGKNNSNYYAQLKSDNFVIQAYPESLIIIARKRYYANNPYHTIQEAMKDILELLDWFCERFKFNFFADGVPHIELRNNDFNRLKDVLANKVREKGGSFLVEIDKRRKVWVDMSEPFGKEANYPKGQEKLEEYTKDILINNPPTLSEIVQIQSETAQHVNKLASTVSTYGEHMKSHIKAIKDLSKGVNQLVNVVDKLKQTRLGDFI